MFHAEPAGIRSWSSELEVGDLLLLLLKFETSIAIIYKIVPCCHESMYPFSAASGISDGSPA
jgi:hypothetical protein